jgi:hypothetical protein
MKEFTKKALREIESARQSAKDASDLEELFALQQQLLQALIRITNSVHDLAKKES